ncbi:hypothetical protein [uncultured Sphingomonas sp.]|uniref:hypothetical protein n=1 Tax=uncultured Sphingomonas sp. TaxID=158754 RepID=UPI002615A4DF|nr:hypothetical protein [uncultured Sphingomonas sp.]
MAYNIDELAKLYDDTQQAAEGSLREMIALAVTWGEDRFDLARIETPTQEVYGPDAIEEIARTEGLYADQDEGHPS